MYSGPIVDIDVHHTWDLEQELLPYLPRAWRDLVELSGRAPVPLVPASLLTPHPQGFNRRSDAIPPNGGRPGSDYPTMKDQLLDRYNVYRALVTYDVGENAGIPNVYLASQVCRAANDWCIDTWLSGIDDRLYGSILVATQVPEDGAREVRRLGSHPRMAEVLLVVNGLSRPFGHPAYHPIYKAAVEVGLPVKIHLGGDLCYPAAQTSAGGLPSSRLEQHATLYQAAEHHLVSLFTYGVFDKFPELRVMLTEGGVAWLPSVMWSLDSHYKILKSENPSIKRLPSEYLRESVRLTTQPLEMSPERDQLIQLLEAYGGFEDLLCFATDYPHWNNDDPTYIAKRLPESWLPKVFLENALNFYRWPPPDDLQTEPRRPNLKSEASAITNRRRSDVWPAGAGE